MGFQSLHILRPSLLLFGAFIAEWLSGLLRKYKPIHARTVAVGMYKAAQSSLRGTKVYLSDEIANIS
jgi:hypothetical protein